jgi:hypothetical protein
LSASKWKTKIDIVDKAKPQVPRGSCGFCTHCE